MGKKYAQRLDELHGRLLMMGEEHGYQKACDFIALALSDSEIMGGRPLSGEKIARVLDAATKSSEIWYPAYCTVTDPEADVLQDKMDRRLRELFGEKFVPFEERYSMLKKCRYGKR